MTVFVLGNDGKPLMPCSEKRARLLLEKGCAIVKRVKPFIIQLKNRNQINSQLQNLELKIDPGSKTTGICLTRTNNKIVNVISLIELEHRGLAIKSKMEYRRLMRRSRRNRKTRYRQARFLNRCRQEGWLPPSHAHIVETTISWINRLVRWTPIVVLVIERVKFDTQKLQNPEINGVEYQQGTLFQYEVKEYLLKKFNHTCVYCGTSNAIFEIEHVIARALGGTNRISNLVLACVQCNKKKGCLPIEVFLKDKPKLLEKIYQQLKTSFRDASVMNVTRNRLFSELLKTGLPVETGTGGQTKFNRSQFNIPKTHALDAACVGSITGIKIHNLYHVSIKSTGRGRYSRTLLNKYGFPRGYLSRTKTIFGFRTGDIVKYKNKRFSTQKDIVGRVVVRKSLQFAVFVKFKEIYQTHPTYCALIQRADGYEYSRKNYSTLSINDKLLVLK